jgi:hypothetical protein
VSRGPIEPVIAPPADRPGRDLPLATWARDSRVVRIHAATHAPIFFSPAPGHPPAGRFDSPAGRFRVLYAALHFEGAFAETLLRKPSLPLLSLSEIRARALTFLTITRQVRLVDLTGPGLSRLGLDARFLSGGYEACGAWADALHGHPAAPDGILHPSRLDPSQLCVALFDRIAPRLEAAGAAVPLTDMLADIAPILDRYGKALDPA